MLPEIRGPHKPKNTWLSNDMPMTLSEAANGKGGKSAANIYFSTPEVRRVVDFIAHSIALVPWHVYRRQGESRERAGDSLAEKAIRHPDPERGVSGYDLIRGLVTDLLVYGHALCLVYEDTPTRIPATLVGRSVDSIGRQTELYVNIDGEKQIVHDMPYALITDWTPHGSIGKSPLLTLRQFIEEQEAANRYHSVLYREAVKITGQFNRPAGEVWSDKARRIFLQQIQEYKNRAAGGAPVLEDGIEYSPVPPMNVLSPADVSARNDFAIQVCTYFGVMPELVGLRSGNYGSVTAYRQMLYGPSLGHYIEAIQGAFNDSLVPALAEIGKESSIEDLYGEFDVLSVSEGTALEKAMTLQTSVGAPIMTAAEARAQMRLPYIEGTDELIMPANVSRGDDQDDADEDVDEDDDAQPQASATDTGKQNVNPESQDRNTRARDRQKERDNQRKQRRKSVSKSAERVTSNDPVFNDVAMAVEPYLEEMTADAQTLSKADMQDKWGSTIMSAISPILTGAAVGASVREQIAHGGSAKLPADLMAYMASFSQSDALRAVAAVYGATRVLRTLADTDENAEEREHAIRDRDSRVAVLTDISKDNAQSVGKEHGAKTAGAVKKVWHHSGAVKDPRHPHVLMDGEQINLGDKFSNGARFPRDPFVQNAAEENVNCQCFTEYLYE